MLRWWIALAGVMAMPSPSDACQCNELTEAQYVEGATFAFDGTVLGEAPRDPPKPCTEPTRASVRPGCLEIGVFDRDACMEIQRAGRIVRDDKETVWETKYAGDDVVRARVCKLATGTYTIDRYNGPPRTFAFDAKLGGSVMLESPTMFNAWRIRVRVDVPIKGDLAREVFIRSSGSGGGGCGIDTGPAPGERLRFFLQPLPDGDLGMNACSGWHDVDDKTPKLPRVIPAATQVPPAPASPPPEKKSGCNAGGDAGLALVLLALTRRACRRARTRSRRGLPR